MCTPFLKNDKEALLADYVTWLISHELGPLVHHRYQKVAPALAAHLQADTYAALAENSLHFKLFSDIAQTLAAAEQSVVLLKGMALAEDIYENIGLRTMSDIDIWIHPNEVETAVQLLGDCGFKVSSNDKRPLPLQLLAQGEIQLYRPNWKGMLVELHWSPFPGWWLRHTSVVDHQEIWQRRVPMPSLGPNVYQLSPEDMLIQMAVHLSATHQFDVMTIRNLIDLSIMACKKEIDWNVVIARAQKWQLTTAVYMTLYLLRELIDLPVIDPYLAQLKPSRLKVALLHRFISAEQLLAGYELKHSLYRYLFLLLLADRWQDAVKLFIRTVWPDSNWLAARYGRPTRLWQHLWHLIKHREL